MEELLKRYVTGQVSAEERIEVRNYLYADTENLQHMLELMRKCAMEELQLPLENDPFSPEILSLRHANRQAGGWSSVADRIPDIEEGELNLPSMLQVLEELILDYSGKKQ